MPRCRARCRRSGPGGRSGLPNRVLQPRRFAGLLHVHAEIDQVDQHLHLSLRLHVAAHDAEDEPRLAVLRHHRRDDRVERPLVRFQSIGVLRVEGEQHAAILEGEAEFGRHQAGAEADVVALDQRDAVAVLIDHAQINRIALSQLRVAGPACVNALSWSISLHGRRRTLGDQSGHWHLGESGIGVEIGARSAIGQLLRFEDQRASSRAIRPIFVRS